LHINQEKAEISKGAQTRDNNMVKIVEMDEKVTLSRQLEEDIGSVILLNKFTVKPQDVDEFLKVFSTTTEFFKQQPGFISAQLHRGIAGSSTFFNYVVWESVGHFKQAFNRPEFRSRMADVLPYVVMSPHLFKKVAVPGICVD
jgi:heme-degrading monooxygenase HmoA